MSTFLSLFPPPPNFYILSKKYLFTAAWWRSMTQIRIWKHGTAVAIASIFCCSSENVHKFSQVMSFCTSAHTDRVENLTVEKIRSTAGCTETCWGRVCVCTSSFWITGPSPCRAWWAFVSVCALQVHQQWKLYIFSFFLLLLPLSYPPSPWSWLERNTANYPSRMRIQQKSLSMIG